MGAMKSENVTNLHCFCVYRILVSHSKTWQVVWLYHISVCQFSMLINGDLSREADGFLCLDFPENRQS